MMKRAISRLDPATETFWLEISNDNRVVIYHFKRFSFSLNFFFFVLGMRPSKNYDLITAVWLTSNFQKLHTIETIWITQTVELFVVDLKNLTVVELMKFCVLNRKPSGKFTTWFIMEWIIIIQAAFSADLKNLKK